MLFQACTVAFKRPFEKMRKAGSLSPSLGAGSWMDLGSATRSPRRRVQSLWHKASSDSQQERDQQQQTANNPPCPESCEELPLFWWFPVAAVCGLLSVVWFFLDMVWGLEKTRALQESTPLTGCPKLTSCGTRLCPLWLA